jgi:hypothetical protein
MTSYLRRAALVRSLDIGRKRIKAARAPRVERGTVRA